jgi:hypothetical protein
MCVDIEHSADAIWRDMRGNDARRATWAQLRRNAHLCCSRAVKRRSAVSCRSTNSASPGQVRRAGRRDLQALLLFHFAVQG